MGELIGGILGGVGSIAGAVIQSQAADKAAQAALTGYNYLTTGAGAGPTQAYVNAGQQGLAGEQAIQSQESELLGIPSPQAVTAQYGSTSGTTPVPGAPGSPGSPGSPGGVTGPVNGFVNSTTPVLSVGGLPVNGSMNSAPTAATPATAGTPGALGAPGATGGLTSNNAFNNYLNSTGYQFQLGQGTGAIVANNATKGLLNSGATLKAVQANGQNLASNYFNNYLNQLNQLNTQRSNLASSGQNATTTVANAGAGAGSAAAPYIAAQGNAISSGINNALGSFSNAFGAL